MSKTPTGQPIRVGLIGAGPGGWGHVAHVPALRALPEFELAAVCTTRPETAEAAARSHGVGKWFWDPATMLADPDIDLVSVCVRVEEHVALVRATLAVGKHVYCEWPLASTIAEAEDLAKLASERGVVAAIGLQARYSPDLIWLRAALADGLIGRVLSSSLQLSAPWSSKYVYNQKRASGGNLLPILGGHALEGQAFLLGEIDTLSATASVQVPEVEVPGAGLVSRDAPEHIAVSGLLEGGALFTFALYGGPSLGTGLRWEIHGTDADLVLLPGEGGGSVQRASFRMTRIGKDAAPEDLMPPPSVLQACRPAPKGPAFNVAQSYAALAEAIGGAGGEIADFDHALRRHRLVDAIYRSAETGRRLARGPDGRFES